jgi:hypothetical protein
MMPRLKANQVNSSKVVKKKRNGGMRKKMRIRKVHFQMKLHQCKLKTK